jgi:Helix-turn-helix domain
MTSKARYVTVRQAADALGIQTQFVYVLLWNHQLEGHKEKGRWLISARSIAARNKQQGERNGRTQYSNRQAVSVP